MIVETENDQSFLTDFETTYVKAEAGKRFANFLMDNGFFNLFIWLFSLIVRVLFPLAKVPFAEDDHLGLWEILINLVEYIIFMFVQEKFLNGKTIAKFITGTRAVNIDGSKLTYRTALLRSVYRIVPFEAFSAFGSPPFPWHDKWANTMVIDEKKSEEITFDVKE